MARGVRTRFRPQRGRSPAHSTARGSGRRAITVDRFVRDAAARARAGRVATVEITNSPDSHRRLFAAAGHRHLLMGPAEPTPYGLAAGPAPLPIDDAWCGVVLCIGVIERLVDPLHLLTELNRVLSDDGHLYLVAPLVMKSGSPLAPANRAHLGMNYLLETTGFTMVEHRSVRDRNVYAIVAGKTRSLSARCPVLPPRT